MRNKVKIYFYFLFLFLFKKKFSDETVTPSVNNSTSQGQNSSSGTAGETSTGKWVSVSARRSGAGTAYPGDRGSTRGGAYAGRGSDMRKQGHYLFYFLVLFLIKIKF
jgi:hypothetical protein